MLLFLYSGGGTDKSVIKINFFYNNNYKNYYDNNLIPLKAYKYDYLIKIYVVSKNRKQYKYRQNIKYLTTYLKTIKIIKH